MFTSLRASVVLAVFVASLPMAGCMCDEPRAVAPPGPAICIPQEEMLPAVAPLVSPTIVPGTLQASFSVDESGQPVVHVQTS